MDGQNTPSTEPTNIPVANAPAAADEPNLTSESAAKEAEPQTAKPPIAKKKPPMAIIAAVIFAVLLAIATVYVYVSGKDKPKDSSTSQTSNSSQQADSTTDQSAATDASDAADDALSSNDNQDLPDSDLTDQNLGLQN